MGVDCQPGCKPLSRGYLGCCLLHGYVKADLLETLDEPACAAAGMKTAVVMAAEFVIHCAIVNDIPGNNQQSMCDGEGCLLAAASG